jgi:hypothetical protein
MEFTVASAGAGCDGGYLSFVSLTPDGRKPWALVDVPISSMLTAAGVAWIEFVHLEGDGRVALLAAPETLRTTAGLKTQGPMHGLECGLRDGWLMLDHHELRGSTSGWGDRITPGERVRMTFVAATRMVSVVWRGRPVVLAALPATHDIRVTRFGALVNPGNSVRITAASTAGASSRALFSALAWRTQTWRVRWSWLRRTRGGGGGGGGGPMSKLGF